ncbi:MAG: acetyltransferase [Thiotrichales bacterium]
MFLKQRSSGDLVEILDTQALFNPFDTRLNGRLHIGEDPPEPEPFAKVDLVFPSGEALPVCWVDPTYRERELRR